MTAFNGKTVTRSAELQRLVGNAAVNSSATLTILRGGQEMKVTARLDKLKNDSDGEPSTPPAQDDTPDANATAAPNLGLSLSPVTPQLTKRFGLKSGKGLVIVKVNNNSPAADAGLRPGDVIERVGQTSVTTAAQLRSTVNAILNKQTDNKKTCRAVCR